MQRYLAILSILVSGCMAAAEPKVAPVSRADTPESIAADLWEVMMAQSPGWATMLGDRRYDAVLPDVSEGVRQATRERKKTLLKRLEALNLGFLDGQSRITARVLAVILQQDLDREVCQFDLWSVDQLAGFQASLPQLATYQQIDSATAAAAYLTRLERIGVVFDQHIANLKQGLAGGYKAPRVAVERVLHQLDDMLATPAEASPYLGVMARVRGLDAAAKNTLRADIVTAVTKTVQPVLRRYRTYLNDAYLLSARDEVGVLANPNGQACYQALMREYSAGVLTAERLHSRGLSEVESLRQQMLHIAKEAGYSSIAAYAAALDHAPEQHVTSRDALLERARALVDRAQRALPRAFGRLPSLPVEVQPIETYREQDAPAAYYSPAANDGSHAAYFYINTYKPETRPLYNLEALTFHEAVPGHHLQLALAQGALDMPQIRRHMGPTTFIEGWALYAELMSDELGLYSSPAARFGMLNFQAWRAARLVVDTGLHALGWNRARAIAFMNDNLVLPETEISNEVDRYIIWPGQALAYMSGRMALQLLRQDAQKKLGPRFNLPDFHDHVLANGAVPLPVLREAIAVWLASPNA